MSAYNYCTYIDLTHLHTNALTTKTNICDGFDRRSQNSFEESLHRNGTKCGIVHLLPCHKPRATKLSLPLSILCDSTVVCVLVPLFLFVCLFACVCVCAGCLIEFRTSHKKFM